jgi:hypothetical protein
MSAHQVGPDGADGSEVLFWQVGKPTIGEEFRTPVGRWAVVYVGAPTDGGWLFSASRLP